MIDIISFSGARIGQVGSLKYARHSAWHIISSLGESEPHVGVEHVMLLRLLLVIMHRGGVVERGCRDAAARGHKISKVRSTIHITQVHKT